MPPLPPEMIVFSQVTQRGVAAELWKMHPDGSGRTRLTQTPQWEGPAAFSPSGAHIAFVRSNWRSLDIYELCVMDADGGNVRSLYSPPEGTQIDSPSWSPDGQRLAFAESRESSPIHHIAMINVDGTNYSRLCEGLGVDWSPAGDKLLVTDRVGTVSGLVSRSLEGGLRTILREKAVSGRWSPDGQKIAYVNFDAANIDDQWVWVMNADGSGSRRVTRMDGRESNPQWSRDGKSLIIERFGGSYLNRLGRLYRVDLETGSVAEFETGGLRRASLRSGPSFRPLYRRAGNWAGARAVIQAGNGKCRTEPVVR